MIYLYSFKDSHHLYKKYIETLLSLYDNLINNIIVNKFEDIIKYIDVNDLKYLNHILITNINENIIKKIINSNINIYILNTSSYSNNDNLSYLNNLNLKIIVYNSYFKKYFQKYSKNIFYLPIPITNIYNYNKIYDIAILDNFKKSDQKNILDLFKKENLNVINISNNILYKHKIFINLGDENELMNEYVCYNCIFNNVIVINDKKNKFNNNFLNNYIFDIHFDFIDLFINFVLENYDNIEKKLLNNLQIKNNKNIIKNITNNFFESITEKNNFGFIILRYVNSVETNEYWIHCYNCIRKFYKNKIIIIDDNSISRFLTNIDLLNCEVINSEFKQSGEILPYYYLYKYKFFSKAVIIHDSVFINKYINFEEYNSINFIWHFTHHWDKEDEELDLLKKLDNEDLINFYLDKEKWYGCFGLQTVIDYSFLKEIQDKYNIFSLINYINNREKRMNFERIFGLICMYENRCIINNPSIYGKIHHYIHWGYLFSSYKEDKSNNKLEHLDIIKVWSGR